MESAKSNERRFRKATIKDVASMAGVSVTAVSLFVSGRPGVCSVETAKRIRAAIDELHYTPNAMAGRPNGRLQSTVGVCAGHPLTSIVGYGLPFFMRLWSGIFNEADANNYGILSYPASVRYASSGHEAFLDGRVDGILLHAPEYADARTSRIIAAGLPVVMLNRLGALPDECGASYADEEEVIALALSHLWELGHRRIAHLAGPTQHMHESGFEDEWRDDVAVRRLAAYQSWMTARGAFDSSLEGYAHAWFPAYVEAAMDAWLALPNRPTAVLAANDALAVGIIEKARARGIRVPEDLSVVGIDNFSATLDPKLTPTSIDIPLEEVGREAMRILLRMLTGAPIEQCRSRISGARLIIRNTTVGLKL